MDEAERCDRVHVLNEGRSLADGEPRALMRAAGADTFQDYFLQKVGATA
jgi:ABC-type multidrug transport system ATPase subunit